MPITDPVSNVYMQNMNVTGGNGGYQANAAQNTQQADAASNTNAASGGSGISAATFTELLSSMMTMSSASIGSFGGGYDSEAAMNGLSGMGSGMSGLSGGSDNNSMIMMLLLMMLMQQNGGGQNTDLLSTLSSSMTPGNMSSASQSSIGGFL